MEYESIKRIYHNYSNVYDFLFKHVFFPRQRHAILSMDIQPNEKILDVGIGTGLTLPIYPQHCQVTGIDLSRSMLEKARKKKEKHSLHHVTLLEMDACNLEFEDDSFDQVIATFVVSVVPDPVKAVREMKRVCKPNRPITLVNHFRSTKKLIAMGEDLVDPVCRKLGWRSTLALDSLAREAGLTVRSSIKMKKFDPWTIVFGTNTK
ncbi:MAG: methyltransferase domain-containing protein [Nitrospinae bacterium]|nr:methyltransferase domain-containing protein [Nitrospinota bacterium]